MGEPSIEGRRRYDNRARQEKAAQTRERIVAAGRDLVHGFDSWNWRDLPFRAVAERAGVGERTVYRHFPTERHLHDAVMARLEEEAGVTHQGLDPPPPPPITPRGFSPRPAFSAPQAGAVAEDALLVEVDQRRRDALLHAVTTATPTWTETERRRVAALLDVVWSMPAYERLVGAWDLDGDDATDAITWLMSLLTQAIDEGRS